MKPRSQRHTAAGAQALPTAPPPAGKEEIVPLPRAQIRPGAYQPRRHFAEDAIEELAAAIRAQGVLTPLLVVPDGEGTYQLVAGERRWRAAERAGVTELPCRVLAADRSDLQELAVLDNLHRQDLRPLEQAEGLRRLAELGLSQREIARRLGQSQPWVSQRLALLELPEEARAALDSGGITYEEARELRKIAAWPDWIRAVVRDLGRSRVPAMQKLLGRDLWVPEDVVGRVKLLLSDHHEKEKLARQIAEVTRQGKTVVSDYRGDGDKRYWRLDDHPGLGAVHDRVGLTCEAYAVHYGQVVRLCTDRPALNRAWRKAKRERQLEPWELKQEREEAARKARRQAISAIAERFAASGRPAAAAECAAVARDQLARRAAYYWSAERTLPLLGRWCGWSEPAEAIPARAQAEIATAAGPELLRLWFLAELAEVAAQHYGTQLPVGVAGWLAGEGFVDPFPVEADEASASPDGPEDADAPGEGDGDD